MNVLEDLMFATRLASMKLVATLALVILATDYPVMDVGAMTSMSVLLVPMVVIIIVATQLEATYVHVRVAIAWLMMDDSAMVSQAHYSQKKIMVAQKSTMNVIVT